MSNETNERNSNNNGQYGKKGFKPRKSNNRATCDLDKIQTNDPKYWNKAKNFENVSKFVWDLIIGYPRQWRDVLGLYKPAALQLNPSNLGINPPQVMAIDVVLGPGYAESVNDGVNRSLAQMMSKIRATLSTSNIGFETADLGYLLTSTSSIASNIAYAKRALESYTVWKDRNYAYPRMLLALMGFNYSDIRDNIQKYSAKLNALIDMYNNLNLLDIFDIYERQYSMMHNIFCDEDSDLGQLYFFRPTNYYIYQDKEFKSKSESLDIEEGCFSSFDSWLTIIDQQINSWYGSNDFYQINGVLLRAFKDAPRQTIPYFDMGEEVAPVQDRAFLMQIMNCTICPVDSNSLDIKQDPESQNYLIWQPKHVFPSGSRNVLTYPIAEKQILRLYDTDISLDDNMELTRLLNFGVEVSENGDSTMQDCILYKYCGSEIVNRIVVAIYDSTTDSIVRSIVLSSNYIEYDQAFAITSLQAFRYLPCFIPYEIETLPDDTKALTFNGFLGDVYNWMLYDREDWKILQLSAYQSLWTPKNI